jgi:hypothetical protein
MKADRAIALEQIVADLERLSVEEQIWLVERLTDRILIQMDQPTMAIVLENAKLENVKVKSAASKPTLYTGETPRFDAP